jgi:hypothetical protein
MSVVSDRVITNRKDNKMIELTFETWEEFDKAISGIVKIVSTIAEENNK